MRPIVTNILWSVCLLDSIMSCAKTVEQFEIQLGVHGLGYSQMLSGVHVDATW